METELLHQLRAQGAVKDPPCVLGYMDYRQFLSEWMGWKKSVNPRFSGAVFAQKASLQSHTFLGMVIRGQRNLTYNSLFGFIRALGLKGKPAKYFEKLVHFNQSKHPKEKQDHLLELLTIGGRGENGSTLKTLAHYTDYLNAWYISVIRELVSLPDFSSDPDWISSKLNHKITKPQIKKAWQILLELNLVQPSATPGQWELVDDALEIDSCSLDFAILNYHRQFLHLGLDSLDTGSAEERELSSLTIAVSEEELNWIKERMSEMRRELNLRISNSAKDIKKYVVALNSQLLVLSGQKD